MTGDPDADMREYYPLYSLMSSEAGNPGNVVHHELAAVRLLRLRS
jgi:hypothetical protein